MFGEEKLPIGNTTGSCTSSTSSWLSFGTGQDVSDLENWLHNGSVLKTHVHALHVADCACADANRSRQVAGSDRQRSYGQERWLMGFF